MEVFEARLIPVNPTPSASGPPGGKGSVTSLSSAGGPKVNAVASVLDEEGDNLETIGAQSVHPSQGGCSQSRANLGRRLLEVPIHIFHLMTGLVRHDLCKYGMHSAYPADWGVSTLVEKKHRNHS